MQSFLRFLFASYRHAPWDTGISPPELLAFIQTHPPGRVLDLGCGTGTNVITLARHGWQVTGVDFIPRSIRTARRKTRQAGVDAQFLLDSVASLRSLAGPFNLILDIGCYHSLSKNQRLAYQYNLNRLLADGGSFLLYGFLSTQETGNSRGICTADLDAFSSFLSLASRADGWDANTRPSTWLQYSKTAEIENHAHL